MNQSRKINVTFHEAHQNATVLRSDEDYERWYLEQFDFSMFNHAEAEKAMEDERPDYYPCIPLVRPGSYEVMYLGEAIIKHWFLKFDTETSH